MVLTSFCFNFLLRYQLRNKTYNHIYHTFESVLRLSMRTGQRWSFIVIHNERLHVFFRCFCLQNLSKTRIVSEIIPTYFYRWYFFVIKRNVKIEHDNIELDKMKVESCTEYIEHSTFMIENVKIFFDYFKKINIIHCLTWFLQIKGKLYCRNWKQGWFTSIKQTFLLRAIRIFNTPKQKLVNNK